MSTVRLSPTVAGLASSATLVLNARIQAMQADGIDVINFTAGEPDFPTPRRIARAAIRAIETGLTRYTAVRGILPLRKAIVTRVEQDYGLSFEPDDVVVSNGGKQCLDNLWRSLLAPGDEVIVVAPYWVSYPPQIQLAGGVPIVVRTRIEEGFQLDVDRVAAACSPRTRAVLLNSPANPSGVTIGDGRLAAIAELCCDRELLLVTDDLYYKMVYGDFRWRHPASLVPEVLRNSLIIGGVSKAYAMTGWRIGYALGPRPLIDAMIKVQAQATSNPCTISQYAALEALTGMGGDEEVTRMVAEFERRRDLMYQLVAAIPGLECVKPQGAFYVFPRVSAYFGRRTPDGRTIASAMDLLEYLIDTARVAGVPGSAFGGPDHIRFSYACGVETIEAGMARVAGALDGLM